MTNKEIRNPSILSMFRLVLRRTERKHKLRFLGLASLRFCIGFFESFTVAWIAGFASWIVDIDNIRRNKLYLVLERIAPGAIPEDPGIIVLWGTTILFFLVLTRNGFRAATIYMSNRFSILLQVEYGQTIMQASLERPYLWYLSKQPTEIIQVFHWRTAIGGFLQQYLAFQTQLIVMGFLAATMIALEPLLSASVICIMAALAFLMHRIVRPCLDRYSEELKTVRKTMLAEVTTSLYGVKDIKLHNLGAYVLLRLSRRFKDVVRLSIRRKYAVAMPSIVINIVSYGILMATVYIAFGGRNIEVKGLVGSISLVAIISWRVLPMILGLQGKIAAMRMNYPHIRGVLEFLDREDGQVTEMIGEPSNTGESTSRAGFERLEIKKVEFSYPTGAGPSTSNVSLLINRGEKIGIIGHSGGGKTTLLDLISGLLSPSKGHISITGTLGESLSPKQWREISGYMAQNPYFFPGTLEENIALGVPYEERDHSALQSALSKASAVDLYESFKERSEELRDRGTNISGGQAQRLALTRLFYEDKDFVIIDEGTSNLDLETEGSVVRFLVQNDGKTVLMATHRIETLRLFNRVLWIEDGQIRRDGPAAEVIREFLISSEK